MKKVLITLIVSLALSTAVAAQSRGLLGIAANGTASRCLNPQSLQLTPAQLTQFEQIANAAKDHRLASVKVLQQALERTRVQLSKPGSSLRDTRAANEADLVKVVAGTMLIVDRRLGFYDSLNNTQRDQINAGISCEIARVQRVVNGLVELIEER
jgi:hypothetical protein